MFTQNRQALQSSTAATRSPTLAIGLDAWVAIASTTGEAIELPDRRSDY